MPTGNVARKFFERLAQLEERVEHLMTWQKWQMGILAVILAAVVLRAI
jgi:hypothetical protein